MGKNDAANEAKQARADEQARQDKIRSGTARINSIFDGATTGQGALGVDAAYDPNATYYLADGTKWSPSAAAGPASAGGMAGGGNQVWGQDPSTGSWGYISVADTSGRGGAAAGATLTPAQQFAQMKSSGKLFSGTASSSGFGDDYFGKQRQAYIDYATPQLEDQYGKANRELTFALARSGNLNSSTRGEKVGELQKLYDTNKQSVADQALSYETDARNKVEDARANLISNLNATGDAEGAASAALSRATALSQPTAYSPLSNLFADFTSTLGTQAAQERAAAASGGSYTPRYSTGLFANSGRVVNR